MEGECGKSLAKKRGNILAGHVKVRWSSPTGGRVRTPVAPLFIRLLSVLVALSFHRLGALTCKL